MGFSNGGPPEPRTLETQGLDAERRFSYNEGLMLGAATALGAAAGTPSHRLREASESRQLLLAAPQT